VAGAVLGTSTVTSYVESSSGVEVGGRTGLTSCITGLCFLISILFAPLVLATVTNAVTAPALIVVGILMAQQLGGVDWDDFVCATSGFVTIITMILSYSISYGIALGFITYLVAMVATGKRKEVSPIVWGLNIIFILYFILI
ncbi:MAG: solute carrier family 23 protein, partial [Lachnospiraceae bacterium]